MQFWWAYVVLGGAGLASSGVFLWMGGPAGGLRAGYFAMLGLFVIVMAFMLRRQRDQFAAARRADGDGN